MRRSNVTFIWLQKLKHIRYNKRNSSFFPQDGKRAREYNSRFVDTGKYTK